MRAFGLMDMPRRMTVLFRDVEKKRRSHSREVVIS
jgi:hypothetical protein